MDDEQFGRDVRRARRRLSELERRTAKNGKGLDPSLVDELGELRWSVERLEEGRRESEERLREALKGAPVVLWAFDRFGLFTLLEGKGMEALRSNTRAQVGKSVFDVYAHVPAVLRATRRVLAGEEFSETFDVDGVAFESQYVPLRDEQGNVIGASGFSTDVTARVRAETALRESEEKFKKIFESSLDAIAMNGLSSAQYLEVNAEFLNLTGFSREEIIGRTTAELGLWADAHDRNAVGRTIRRRGFARNIEAKFRRKDETIRWALFSSVVIEVRGQRSILSFIRDITERKEAETALRELSGRLLQLQDEERRRLALELHDSTAQSLAAQGLNLGLVSNSVRLLPPRARKALAESITMGESCLREVRTLSYLLHPPELDEAGLSSAIRSYADGFSERSGIRVRLKIPRRRQRLPREVETTLFRIVQECLTNIHRHSGSPTATIQIRHAPRTVRLEIVDRGRGISAHTLVGAGKLRSLGVGIAGMRERVRQLGGHLEIRSRGRGTSVKVSLPSGRRGVG